MDALSVLVASLVLFVYKLLESERRQSPASLTGSGSLSIVRSEKGKKKYDDVVVPCRDEEDSWSIFGWREVEDETGFGERLKKMISKGCSLA
ncbi:hypothetical protein LWI28_014228 [Acer negundo]|uniref:Uncharacterized protein n=1 Tax=Acer negundo TaxID=4023 RepID=A0AAD5JR34_ACENE|nr:hypothetical protein LWI28_014228 [Acer negundo]